MGKTVSEVGKRCGTGVVCESYESVVYKRIDEAQVSEVGVMRPGLHSLCYHAVQCIHESNEQGEPNFGGGATALARAKQW